MRRAIVTGGMSGLGAACTTRLKADGVDVVTFDVSPDADFTVDEDVPSSVELRWRPDDHQAAFMVS